MPSYTTIKIPTSFCEKYIDPLLETESLGFSSRAELVKVALRNYYDSERKEQETNPQ